MTRRPTALVVVALVAAGACISGGGVVSPASPSQTQSAATATPAAARPARCRVVQPGELGTALGTAAGGDALCLADGVHPGPITIDRPVTVWGTRRAIIRSHGLFESIGEQGDNLSRRQVHRPGGGVYRIGSDAKW